MLRTGGAAEGSACEAHGKAAEGVAVYMAGCSNSVSTTR